MTLINTLIKNSLHLTVQQFHPLDTAHAWVWKWHIRCFDYKKNAGTLRIA